MVQVSNFSCVVVFARDSNVHANGASNRQAASLLGVTSPSVLRVDPFIHDITCSESAR